MKNFKRKILLVDDSKVFQMLFKTVFTNTNNMLFICNSGEEALKLIGDTYIDFICSAYHLRDMEGIALCKKIREITKFAYKPFIILTAYRPKDALKIALPAGVTDIFHRDDVNELFAYIMRFPFSSTQFDGRILYVEDQRSQREATKAMLIQHGLTVDAFASVEEAWPYFLENNYDVVLTDIVLEGKMSGAGFISQIRRQTSKKGDTPILAISAFNDTARRIGLYNLGVTDYIAKPVVEEELLARINSQINKHRRDDERVKFSERVFHEAHEAITITNTTNIIIDVNPAFSNITGYSREEAIGQNINMLKSGKHQADFYQNMWQAIKEHGHWDGEIWNKKKNGELYAQWITISPLVSSSGEVTHYVGLFSDITQLKLQQQKMELMAHYDALTKLPNRFLLMDRFNQLRSRANRDNTLLAVCYLDLDDFKQINDHYGHATGDMFLIHVGNRIKAIIREEDTVSRLGGDEFVILLSDFTTIEQCEQSIDRIHKTITQPYLIENKWLQVNYSCGVTVYPNDNSDPEALLRHADKAMYQAKESGRNRCYFYDAISNIYHNSELHIIEKAFHNDELCLYYQPKINLKSGEVYGAEALIRWHHPEHGILLPLKFLPIIKGTSLENKLDQWVILQVLNQLNSWRKNGLNIQVSVNISPNYLQLPSFFADLDSALAKFPKVKSNQLELEILESNALDSLMTISNTVNSCVNLLGVSFALDDFGTGYSSLSHLRYLPVTTVKIDQSFVRNMLFDTDDFSIVNGVIGLTQAFNRKVIAEGTETVKHIQTLASIGCHLFQGYAIAKPMPADELPKWICEWELPLAWLLPNIKSIND